MLENYKHYEENWVHLTGGLEVWDVELGIILNRILRKAFIGKLCERAREITTGLFGWRVCLERQQPLERSDGGRASGLFKAQQGNRCVWSRMTEVEPLHVGPCGTV